MQIKNVPYVVRSSSLVYLSASFDVIESLPTPGISSAAAGGSTVLYLTDPPRTQ